MQTRLAQRVSKNKCDGKYDGVKMFVSARATSVKKYLQAQARPACRNICKSECGGSEAFITQIEVAHEILTVNVSHPRNEVSAIP